MYSTAEQPDVARHFPSVWEVLRAASGLVAVSALLVIVGGITLIGESQRARLPMPKVAAANVQTVPDPPATTATPLPQPRKTFVLYVVETLEQVQIAEWGESAAKPAAHRNYRIVSSNAALEAAVQDFVREALQYGEPLLLEVADLR